MKKTLLLILLTVVLFPEIYGQSIENLTIDISSPDKTDSLIKPHMLGVIAGPLPNYNSDAPDLTQSYRDIGVTTIRNNDYFDDRLDMERMFFCGTYPINTFTPRYPQWDCNPADAANYHFEESDIQFQNWLDGGFLPFFRLGGEFAHPIRPHDYKGPRSEEEDNWISASIKVTDRYNKFGGNENTLQGYLNIWTEYPQKNFWDRDSLSFNNFWCNAFDSLKHNFPDLKIGGPGFNSSVSIQLGKTPVPKINTHVDLFLRELKNRDLKPDWIGFHVFSNEISDYYKAAVAFRKLLRAEPPFANVYSSVWGSGDNSFFYGVELICDAWGFDNDKTLSPEVRDSLFNKQRGAAHHVGAFIAFQQADIERAYIYRGGELGSGVSDAVMGLFYSDVAGTYKPAAYGFKLCSAMQTIYNKKLVTPVFSTASGGSIIWSLAGEDDKGNKAILISNPSPNTIHLNLTLDHVDLTTSTYPYINQYQITDTDNGQTPHPWTSGIFVLPPYTANLIEMRATPTAGNKEVNEEKVTLKIFPNPFSSQTTIQISETMSDATILMYDILGRKVQEIKNVEGRTATLSVSHLPGGIYIVQLIRNNIVVAMDKVIISG
ncbi:MAG TPA: T9SS type A sorting domain-containing protein [Saprospiraceae bacterium]|jgi:hypothetical protein|nr:MAG: hypothetical protein UZ08_BCD001002167 [Candidatus Parvibacillus calidus]MCC7147709.1 T9SS type A sorting domain-containing protein [Saprospiraceae bacterium]MCO6461295.1 T9SS type A sorting domain-containing protein [Saprospiraceae bacterium]WKZ62401.1 MAG: T9SS type A sorting domain-containing protein [Saprospiraceae bacterium]HPE09693.1 T9SS type A sorting domain-containing protein [Saprospiraceae bacterium]